MSDLPERNQIPLLHINRYARNTVPSLRWDGSEPISEWKTRIREKLCQLLGMDTFEKCDPDFKLEWNKEENGIAEYRFTFQSEEGYYVPCHLLRQAGDRRPRPLVVCLQGHSKGQHISLGRPKYPGDENSIQNGDRDFAVQAVREGCWALTLDQRCFGECGGNPSPDCMKTAVNTLLYGRTVIGERVWDISRALDTVLGHFTDIDENRIIVLGNSGGGTAAFYAGCLEERFSVVMPSCAFCSYYESITEVEHCICNYIPSIARYADMGDLSGLIAPRLFLPVCGKEDSIFPLNGVLKVYEETKRLFKAQEAENRCELIVGEAGHRFYAEPAWKTMKNYISLL